MKRTGSNLEHCSWICDGIQQSPTSVIYQLKILSYYTPMTYETAYTTQPIPVPNPVGTSYHFRWMHADTNFVDGYYTESEVYHSLNRKNLVNIRPRIGEIDLEGN